MALTCSTFSYILTCSEIHVLESFDLSRKLKETNVCKDEELFYIFSKTNDLVSWPWSSDLHG